MKNRENSDSKQKITLICCAVLIVALLLLGFGEMLNRRAQRNVNKLYDTTVIDYEAYKTRLNDLALIYSIWDYNSYVKAEKMCNISDSLREEIFTGFNGSNYKTAPKVQISDILYDLEPSTDGLRTYYVVLTIKEDSKDYAINYNVIATLSNDVLVDYKVI